MHSLTTSIIQRRLKFNPRDTNSPAQPTTMAVNRSRGIK
jgi:hypothetical protein